MASCIVQIVCGAGYVSGKETVALWLARGLRDAGWKPRFLTSRWHDGEFQARLKPEGFEFEIIPIGFISATLRLQPIRDTLIQLRHWPTLAFRYRKIVASSGARAVIHTNWHHSLLLLPFLDPSRDIQWLHEIPPKNWRYARVFQAIARRVKRIVCVSNAVQRSVEAIGVPKERISVIHNGVPPVNRLVLDESPRLKLGIVGQIVPWKGHDDLIDAMVLLRRGGVKVELHIFGSGPTDYVEALRSKVVERNLEGDVEWWGYIRDQERIFRHIDICLVPSRTPEPLATSAIEAGAFGRPVICSSQGGLPEIVCDGQTGFVVEANRPDQLARAVSYFAQDRELISGMGAAARCRIESDFSLARFADNFVRLLEETPS
jgi:glycosyltransferase involved in cell wall biosynthesis